MKDRCISCAGKGKISCRRCQGKGTLGGVCQHCRGSGKMACSCGGSGRVTCPKCGGTGERPPISVVGRLAGGLGCMTLILILGISAWIANSRDGGVVSGTTSVHKRLAATEQQLLLILRDHFAQMETASREPISFRRKELRDKVTVATKTELDKYMFPVRVVVEDVLGGNIANQFVISFFNSHVSFGTLGQKYPRLRARVGKNAVKLAMTRSEAMNLQKGDIIIFWCTVRMGQYEYVDMPALHPLGIVLNVFYYKEESVPTGGEFSLHLRVVQYRLVNK